MALDRREFLTRAADGARRAPGRVVVFDFEWDTWRGGQVEEIRQRASTKGETSEGEPSRGRPRIRISRRSR